MNGWWAFRGQCGETFRYRKTNTGIFYCHPRKTIRRGQQILCRRQGCEKGPWNSKSEELTFNVKGLIEAPLVGGLTGWPFYCEMGLGGCPSLFKTLPILFDAANSWLSGNPPFFIRQIFLPHRIAFLWYFQFTKLFYHWALPLFFWRCPQLFSWSTIK